MGSTSKRRTWQLHKIGSGKGCCWKGLLWQSVGRASKGQIPIFSQLHTGYYNKVGRKYGLARGFSYDELSEEEKWGRKHKNKVVLEAERQAKVALDKVEKYAVLATIDKKELTIPLLNIKAPVQEAMNAVNKELAIPIPTLIGQKTWQIDFIIFVTYP